MAPVLGGLAYSFVRKILLVSGDPPKLDIVLYTNHVLGAISGTDLITGIVEIGLALICASLPSLRVYMKPIRMFRQRLQGFFTRTPPSTSAQKTPGDSFNNTVGSLTPKSLDLRYIGIAEENNANMYREILMRDETFPRPDRRLMQQIRKWTDKYSYSKIRACTSASSTIASLYTTNLKTYK